MRDGEARTDRKFLVVSTIEEDGTIIEAIYRPETADTALVVAMRDGIVEILPHRKIGDTVIVPPRPANNLIKL